MGNVALRKHLALASLPIPDYRSTSQIATTSSGGADTNFLLGAGREVAIRSGGFDAFSYDGFGSALSTTDTEDLVRASGYDEFGVPNSSEPLPTLLEEVMSVVGDSSKNHTPLFGCRGEIHLNGLLHLRAREYGVGLGRFSSKDPLDGAPGEVTIANPYPYAANDPVNQVDPLGLSPLKDCDLQVQACLEIGEIPVPPSDPGAAPNWLLKRAKRLAKEIIMGTIVARTTGLCGDVSRDTFYSLEIQGCLIDDGDRIGSIEMAAAGVGGGLVFPFIGAGGSLGFIVSNAPKISDLRGFAMCAAISAGLGLGAYVSGSIELCFGIRGANAVDGLSEFQFDRVFTGIFSLNGSVGLSAGSPQTGRIIVGHSWVQEIWDYPSWVGQICGGRIIGNPFKPLGLGSCL